jgi:zinc D-Ala-D-Ala dipeptidase
MGDRSYRDIPIVECHDPLVGIPTGQFVFTNPHPYVTLGAPYAGTSPWLLRSRILAALGAAQSLLAARRPGWQLKLFDAYRPVPVQAFMVWREFQRQAELIGRSLTSFDNPTDLERRDNYLYSVLAQTVFTYWGVPSEDPRMPPPHSTGAAIDLTLQDASGREVDMGCAIDETTERAHPAFYAHATSPAMCTIHASRELLNDVMGSAGFTRHANEWWHFSCGDQMAALAKGESHAVYGRAG